MKVVSKGVREGDLRTLARISLPLMFFLCCENLTGLIERVFLSYYSIEGIQASLSATYLARMFQLPLVAVCTMGQVFVGLYLGSGETKRIGPCIWQLIWFSILSLFITLPLSFFASSWYFRDTLFQEQGVGYFNILSLGNFLFPLSAALSSFYLGRGRTFFVTTLMLGSYLLHLSLSWLLIFGVEGFIPSLGVKGAALAKSISLGVLCWVLFWSFLRRINREVYGTSSWKFSLISLWSYMQPGMVRAFGFLSSQLCWVSVTYIMIKKGGDFLNVLTVGGTLVAFWTFIPNGIYRAILTIASNLIGARKISAVWQLCRSSRVHAVIFTAILAVPFLLFPNSMAYFFDASFQELFRETIGSINVWIWFYLFTFTLQMSLCGLLVAAQDLKAQMLCYIFLWATGFAPVYFGLGLGGWGADKLWLLAAVENLIYSAFFYFQLRKREDWSMQEAQNIPI